MAKVDGYMTICDLAGCGCGHAALGGAADRVLF